MPARRNALRRILHSIGNPASPFSSYATSAPLPGRAASPSRSPGPTRRTTASWKVAGPSVRHASTITAVSSLDNVVTSVGLPTSNKIDNGQQAYVQSLIRDLRNASGARDEVRIRRHLYLARTRGWTATSVRETWQRTLRLMDSMSKESSTHQSELIAETVQVTGGYRLKWLKDPLDTIAHIVEQTSCKMQVLHKHDKLKESSFSRFVLQGTPAQIQAAKRYITNSGHLTMIASRKPVDGKDTSIVGWTDNGEKAVQGDLANRHLLSRPVRPRAVLIRGTSDRIPLSQALLRANTSGAVDTTELESIVLSLIAPHSAEEIKTVKVASSSQHLSDIISPALAALLSRANTGRGSNSSVIRLAFKYLCRHRQFASIHQVLQTHVRPAVTTPYAERVDAIAFSCILDACARNGDSDLFVKTLDIMRQHKLPADRKVWQSFHKLTSRYQPRNTGIVERRIAQLRLYQNSNSASAMLSSMIEQDFKQQLDKIPTIRPGDTTFVQDFIKTVSGKQGGDEWQNDRCLTNLIAHLLDRGHFDSAFYLLEQKRGSPKLVSRVADHFVQSATQVQPADGYFVVDIINKLQRASKEAASGTDGDLRLSEWAYEQLLDFARGTRSWNLWRCFWQHAASDGRLNRRMTSWIRLSLHVARRNKRKPDVSAVTHAWTSNFGTFALGVGHHDGLRVRAELAVREAQKRRCKHSLAHDVTQAWAVDCELLERGIWPPSDGQDVEAALQVVFDKRHEIEKSEVTQISSVKPRRRHGAVRRVYTYASESAL